ncbi:cupin domain-containing protein [Paenibacillus provencensis]|uniref:acireductone dioxygenase (Fe(2+)-requiring) n=1 Tax=Paenibacillus provencensis TaxID=441151 RepID=A0ABW3PKH3_9BACL|nr:cupin domain-containing protein [Paenibacillus sp. MER 78]MCM3126677.1 cupin domain-containing protein [Paenibacillus sp. MER 78]
MPEILIRNTNERISGMENVRNFLKDYNVLYEQWDSTKLPAELNKNNLLSDEEQQQVLNLYKEEISDMAGRHGYQQWEVISLSNATADLEAELAELEEMHTHGDEGAHAILSGNGILSMKADEETGYIDIELTAGDVIAIPENTPHSFALMKNKEVIAVRLTIKENGWTVSPYPDPEYIKNGQPR